MASIAQSGSRVRFSYSDITVQSNTGTVGQWSYYLLVLFDDLSDSDNTIRSILYRIV